jgi:acylphosphatase
MTEIQCIVSGKVQQVAYRAFIQDAATELGLVGYVKNLPNKTVEVVAQGAPDVLKSFVEYLHEGSLMAKVESVAVDWVSAKVTYEEFSVLH